MTRKISIRKLQQLVEIRKNERQFVRGEVFESSHLERNAGDNYSEAQTDRDLVLASWKDSGDAEYIDLSLQTLIAQQLIDQEVRVQKSGELLSLAKNRLKTKQARWKLTDLNLQTAKKVEKKAVRNFSRKKDEAQLSDITDRHCFESVVK